MDLVGADGWEFAAAAFEQGRPEAVKAAAGGLEPGGGGVSFASQGPPGVALPGGGLGPPLKAVGLPEEDCPYILPGLLQAVGGEVDLGEGVAHAAVHRLDDLLLEVFGPPERSTSFSFWARSSCLQASASRPSSGASSTPTWTTTTPPPQSLPGPRLGGQRGDLCGRVGRSRIKEQYGE